MIFVRQQPSLKAHHACGYHPYASYCASSRPHLYVFRSKGEENKPAKTEEKQQSNGATEEKNSSTQEAPRSYRVRNAQVIENKDHFELSFDLPGVKLQDVNIEGDNGVLRVSAERKLGDKLISKFQESLVVDETATDMTKIDAKSSDGVLSITIPKKEPPKPVGITVKAEEPPAKSEESNDLRITVDVPGIKTADTRVEYHNGKLFIQGERKSGERAVYKIQKACGINENTVDTSTLEAFLMDGVLTITASNKEAAPVKKIAVSTENAAETAIEENKKKEEDVVVETVANDNGEQQQANQSSEDANMADKEWQHVLEEREDGDAKE